MPADQGLLKRIETNDPSQLDLEICFTYEDLLENYYPTYANDIATALITNTTLKTIEFTKDENHTIIAIGPIFLKENIATQTIIKAIAIAMANNSNLTSVIFRVNYRIGLTGAQALAKALAKSTTINQLTLDNNITDNEVKIIAQSLHINNSLKILDLRSNEFTHEGVAYITKALENKTNLEELYLADNQLGFQGGYYLEELLKVNTFITTVECYACGIPNDTYDSIKILINRNKKIAEIRSQYNAVINDLEAKNTEKSWEDILIKLRDISSIDEHKYVPNIVQRIQTDITLCKHVVALNKANITGIRQYKTIIQSFKTAEITSTEQTSNFFTMARITLNNLDPNYILVARAAFEALSTITPEYEMYNFAQHTLQNLLDDLSAIYEKNLARTQLRQQLCEDISIYFTKKAYTPVLTQFMQTIGKSTDGQTSEDYKNYRAHSQALSQ